MRWLKAPSHNVALIPGINLALLCLWKLQRADSKFAEWRYVGAIGLLLGLTILIKGLVGVALVAAAYGSYAIITRRLSLAICLRAVVALFLAAVVASVWYIAVEIKNPGYLRYYFVERHILGFATATQTHGEAPWWYYLPIILCGGLPWIGYLPVTFRDAFAREKWGLAPSCPSLTSVNRDQARRLSPFFPETGEKVQKNSSGAMPLLLCWLIGCTVLLSFAHSKLATYIWPVFPAVAVLAAVGWAKFLDGTLGQDARRSLLRTFLLSSFAGPIVLPLVLFAVQKIFAVTFTWPVWIAAILAGFAALIPLIFFKRHQWRAMLAASAISTAVQFVVALVLVLPPLAEDYSARRTCWILQ